MRASQRKNPDSNLDQTREFARVVVKTGEDGLQVGDANVLGENFAENRAKIRGEREIAPFVELMVVQAGPFAIDLPAAHVSTHHEHAICVAVVRAAVAVFARGPAKFAHGNENDLVHAVAQVLMKCHKSLAKIAQQIRELSLYAA